MTTKQQRLNQQLRLFIEHLVEEAKAGQRSHSLSDHNDTVRRFLGQARRQKDFDSLILLLSHFGKTLQRSANMAELYCYLQQVLASAELAREQRVRLADQHALLLLQHKTLDEAEAIIEEVWCDDDGPDLKALLLNRRGVLLEIRTDWNRSLACYTEALALATEAGESALASTILNNMGNWAYAQEKWEEAMCYYEQAVARAGPEGAPLLLCRAVGGVAMALIELARYEESLLHIEQQRLFANHAGDRQGLTRCYLNHSYCLIQQRSDADQALLLASQALDIAQQLADRARIGAAYHNMAAAHRLKGHAQEALHFLALALQQRLGEGGAIYVRATVEEGERLCALIEADAGMEAARKAALLAQLHALQRKGTEWLSALPT